MAESLKFHYPTAHRQDYVREVYHGNVIHDHYHWLEDSSSKETQNFVSEQNKFTADFLEICPYRPKIQELLTKLYNYPTYSCPSKKGSKYFFYQSSELKINSAIYSQERLTDEPVLFMDLNELTSKYDGKAVIDFIARSNDGVIFAYGLSKNQSEWVTVHFKSVETGQEHVRDVLEKIRFSGISWAPDNLGVFYSWYPDEAHKTDESSLHNLHHKVYYHRMGTPQGEDVLVTEFPEHPSRMIGASVTDCGKYLVITTVDNEHRSLTFFAELEPHLGRRFQTKPELIPVIGPGHADSEFTYITNDDSLVYFMTNDRAPGFRLISVNFENCHHTAWKTVIPERGHDIMQWVAPINNTNAFVCYMSYLGSILGLYRLHDGTLLKRFPMELGTITEHCGGRADTEFFFRFESFFTPGTIYQVDFSGHFEQSRRCCSIRTKHKAKEIKNYGSLPPGLQLDPRNYNVSPVWFTSEDGTKIPMFILYKKGFKRNGEAPCFLFPHGALGSLVEPVFHSINIVLMENLGGVIAIVEIRGGKEFGTKWQEAGREFNTQKSFDDFAGAASYLIHKKYTCAKKMVICGGAQGHGGLLGAACCNQRPDLFGGVALLENGLMDMLRYHRYEHGMVWLAEYGSSNERKEFHCLRKYSPLHNIKLPKDKKLCFPAVLCITGDYKEFVAPAHSMKYIAQLQHIMGRSPEQAPHPLMAIFENPGVTTLKERIVQRERDKLVFVILSMEIPFKL